MTATWKTDPTVLRYGYTLDDIHQMTTAALRADRSLAMDYRDRRDIAWSAIVEHLYASDHYYPTREQLIRVGLQAIYRDITDNYRHRGYEGRVAASGYGSAPRFAAYWLGLPQVTPSPEVRIVERVAAEQILPQLKPNESAAVHALAATGDYQAAAAALGISYMALLLRLGRARRRFLDLWHQHETPRRTQGHDRRVGSRSTPLAAACSHGHPWTPENTRWVSRRSRTAGSAKERRCRACDRDRREQRRTQAVA